MQRQGRKDPPWCPDQYRSLFPDFPGQSPRGLLRSRMLQAKVKVRQTEVERLTKVRFESKMTELVSTCRAERKQKACPHIPVHRLFYSLSLQESIKADSCDILWVSRSHVDTISELTGALDRSCEVAKWPCPRLRTPLTPALEV